VNIFVNIIGKIFRPFGDIMSGSAYFKLYKILSVPLSKYISETWTLGTETKEERQRDR
jgi:hypothetical protein